LDEWEIYLTDGVRDWIGDLDDRSRRLVVQAIDILADRGPALGRRLVDHVEHSAVQNLKELRPGSGGAQRAEGLICLRLVAVGGPAGRRR
jgi:hypothetical protein